MNEEGRDQYYRGNGGNMMSGLVLSLFPGIDLLGMAFEAEGFCVVRGPDVIFGGDIRGFHPPAGRFDGVIGGPPCQAFSRLRHIVEANGYKPTFGNLIPEFVRVVKEAGPAWWLMENVPEAPDPDLVCESFYLSPRWLGDPQSRLRKFWFGANGEQLKSLTNHIDFATLESVDYEFAATGGTRSRPVRLGGGGKPKKRRAADSRRNLNQLLAVQGYPELAEVLPGPWTVSGACKAVGNGVPRVVGQALARAVKSLAPAAREVMR